MYKIGPFKYTFKKNEHALRSELPVKSFYCNETITIQDRELILISSPSGAGKSTLLLLLKGIIPQYVGGELKGTILYNNHPLDGENFTKNLQKILFLFQNPFSQLIYPDAAEEFFFSMENFNFSHQEMDKKKEELNEIFNIDILLNKKTSELSNGECQRLVLASLMAIDPDVLLLDEPTAFLDSEARSVFYQWLAKMKGTKTIILVDHHLADILPLADKVLRISSAGEITLAEVSFDPLSFEKRNFSLAVDQSVKNETSVELKLTNIYFHFADQQKLLENITFTVSSGEVVVIRGKNGQGKSTLFKIIAGMLKPQEGKVRLFRNNIEIALKNQFKEIGFVFQNPESHFFYDTIREELGSFEKNAKFKILQETFLSGIDLDRSPFLLSEGEKRRLSLLMTVFLDKSIFLYDEPTFGQDQQSINAIVEMIMHLKTLGKVQIIISHDELFNNVIASKVYDLEKKSLVRPV